MEGGRSADAWPAFGDSKVHYIRPSRMIHSVNRYLSLAGRESESKRERDGSDDGAESFALAL